MNKYVKTKEHFYINIKYLLEVNRKAYRYVVQNFYTRIQPKILGSERFIEVQNIIKFPGFLRKQLVEDFDKKGDKLSFENGKVVLKVKDKKILEYDSNKTSKEETKDVVADEEDVKENEVVQQEELEDKVDVPEQETEEKVEDIDEVKEEADDEIDVPEYDESMLKKELKSIAEEYDVDIDSNDTKSDIIKKLDEKFGN